MFKHLAKVKIKKGVKLLTAGIVLVSIISFVEKQHAVKTCEKVVVNIDHLYDNYFINEQDVMGLVTAAGQSLVGSRFEALNLKQLEQKVKDHHYIARAEVYRDLKGNLIIDAEQARPIARIMNPKGPDAYVAADGKLLPVSDRFTARVMLIGGNFDQNLIQENLKDSEGGSKLYALLSYVNNNTFWRAQLAQMEMDEKGDITFFTQVSKQFVEFGDAENMEEKFGKLMLFYTNILPQKGWNKYEKVNLKYENQIVCE